MVCLKEDENGFLYIDNNYNNIVECSAVAYPTNEAQLLEFSANEAFNYLSMGFGLSLTVFLSVFFIKQVMTIFKVI